MPDWPAGACEPAKAVDADALVLLTPFDGIILNHGTARAEVVREATPLQVTEWITEGYFTADGMGPAVRAALDFAGHVAGNTAVVTTPGHAAAALRGEFGTMIHS